MAQDTRNMDTAKNHENQENHEAHENHEALENRENRGSRENYEDHGNHGARARKHSARFAFLLILLIAAAGIGGYLIERVTPTRRRMDSKAYFGITEDGEAAIVTDGVLSESRGLVTDGSVYLDYATVQKYINPAVFYDENEELLIVTTPTEKRTMSLGEGRTDGGEAVLRDGTLYVLLSYVESVSDIADRVCEEPERVVVTADFDYVTETLTKNAPVRYRAGIKSPILSDVEKGTAVRVFDVAADGTALDGKVEGWTHVSTEDGYTGYVQDKFLENPEEMSLDHTSPVGEYTVHQLDEKVNMVFHQTTNQDANDALGDSLEGVSGVNVIAPTWFFLESDGGEISSIASSSYVRTAHRKGLEVWAVLNDFDGAVASSSSTASALSTDTSRSAIVESVMSEIRESGADGLNIDFEHVTAESAPAFLELVREFSLELRNEGLTLSIDNYVPTFTAYLNRKEQGRVADYVVVMCYDEHTNDSAEAGSVSSLPFVENGIRDTMAEVPAEKVIAAIPFFTRLWTKEGTSLTSTAYGMTGAASCVESLGMTETWDETSGQNYCEAVDGSTKYQMWLEDDRSLSGKMEAIRDSGCAGVAEWKLGLEDSGVWDVISEGLGDS